MHRRRVLALSTALAAGALAGCTGGSPDEDDDAPAAAGPAPDVDDEQLRELVRGTNGFAFDLYRELLDEGGNVFASPVSVSVALAMAYAGARGETRTQMREALRYRLDDENLHEAFAQLQDELDERGEDVAVDTGGGYDEDDEPVPFELSVVNAAWGQEGYPFEQSYLDVLDRHYGGGLREVDYATDAESAREAINDWVADETGDRVKELLPEGALDALTRLVLVNAVYFTANWKHPFSESLTDHEPFTALDGSDHEVPMMRENRSWRYAEVDGAQAVELPYVGGEASMLAVLPPEGEFETYERSFDGETLAAIVDELDEREGTVRLPRFEFAAEFQLKAALRSLGMVDAFDEQKADFGDMARLDETGENLLIDDVYHDAYVAVDEEGTEAAAATGVVVRKSSAPADPFEFVADRPFLFAIRDRPTDAVLFLGRVVDPAGWENQ